MQPLRSKFLVFFIGVFVFTFPVFSDEVAQKTNLVNDSAKTSSLSETENVPSATQEISTPKLEDSSESTSLIQTKTSSTLPEAPQKTNLVDDSTKAPSLAETENVPSATQETTTPKLEDPSESTSLSQTKTSSTQPEASQKSNIVDNSTEAPSSTEAQKVPSPTQETTTPKLKDTTEASPLVQTKTKSSDPSIQDSGKLWIHFSSTGKYQPSKSIFFQANVGVGFLYFSGLRGNLMGRPTVTKNPTGFFRDAPLKGRLSYTKAPLFEYLLGYQFNSWLKLALSYQHEAGVKIQSKALSAFPNTDGDLITERVQFTSNLALDAFLAKVYFESLFGVIWKNCAMNPYLAIGVGPGWQTWTQTRIDYMSGTTFFENDVFPLRQKISANAVWMVDVGLRIQNTSPENYFSIVLGCKYNEWGQARSIGKVSQQKNLKIAITQPVRIKTVYQFAPYLGVQWNFLPCQPAAQPYKLKGKETKVWLPYWAASKEFQCPRSVWTQFNAGVGFLYFSGLRANLMGQPFRTFNPTNLWRDAPLRGRFSYNRTPLFEYLVGYRFNLWLKLALSYQHQAGVTVQSKAINAFSDNPVLHVIEFTSNLALDALLAKVYFELPFGMIWRNLSINPYLACGVGPGWQSWTQIRVDYMFGNTGFFVESLPLRQKFSANAVWMCDVGLRMQSVYPNNQFSVLLGCKYNQWGQARNIGKMSQQHSIRLSIAQPLRIKTVYQFAPYLGVQWNFSADQTAKSAYKLKGKSPQVWLPYWVASREFQCPTSLWTQFNAGVGFLYFSGLRGNLMGRPVENFAPNSQYRDAPIKGRLSYNRTPLFEYLVGYQFNLWFKLALSYQYQGGIAIGTKTLEAFPGPAATGPNYTQFKSNLSLNAVLAKLYFELPFSMIWRSLSTTPYLAVGVGPGWQSWADTLVVYMQTPFFAGQPLPLRQKNSANAVWMVDLGLRLQSAYPNSHFSILLGCKYNQWGQARSIGKMSQQGAHKIALTHPLTVKTIYQFAPYLGVQWSF